LDLEVSAEVVGMALKKLLPPFYTKTSSLDFYSFFGDEQVFWIIAKVNLLELEGINYI